MEKPRNWVAQRHETLPEIPSDTAFICSPADVPRYRKVHLQDTRGLKNYVRNTDRHSHAGQSSSKCMLTQETAHQ